MPKWVKHLQTQCLRLLEKWHYWLMKYRQKHHCSTSAGWRERRHIEDRWDIAGSSSQLQPIVNKDNHNPLSSNLQRSKGFPIQYWSCRKSDIPRGARH